MKKIFIENVILSNEAVAIAIEEQNINIVCNDDMDIYVSEEDYNKLCNIIDPMDIKDVDSKFESIEQLAIWLNDNDDRIADGYIRWSDIQNEIEAAGWEFNANDYWVAYDNKSKRGVRYEVQRNGKELAIVE